MFLGVITSTFTGPRQTPCKHKKPRGPRLRVQRIVIRRHLPLVLGWPKSEVFQYRLGQCLFSITKQRKSSQICSSMSARCMLEPPVRHASRKAGRMSSAFQSRFDLKRIADEFRVAGVRCARGFNLRQFYKVSRQTE